MLFVALLLMPEERLRVGRAAGERGPRVPNLIESLRGGAVLVVVATRRLVLSWRTPTSSASARDSRSLS